MTSEASAVEKYINTSYDVVKAVYDNLAKLTQLADNLAIFEAIKPPVIVAATTDITLFGLQTINTVVLAVGDRVLVTNQNIPVEHGIYIVSATDWIRSSDWDESAEVKSGMLVCDQQDNVIYKSAFLGDFNITTTETTFTIIQAQIGAVASTAGVWVEVSDGVPRNGDTDLDLIWDETLYYAIRIVLAGVRVATSPATITARFGHTNGSTFITSSTGYTGAIGGNMATLASVGAVSSMSLASAGAVYAGSDISMVIDVINFEDAGSGAKLSCESTYRNSSGIQSHYSTRMYTNGSTSAAVVDALRISSNTSWTASGAYKVYGLLK